MKDRWEDELKKASISYNNIPIWMKKIEEKGRQTIVPISLRLSPSEYKRFMEMRVSQELSAQALVRQSLRVYDMYLAGYLVDNSPKSGGCGECP